MKRKKIAMIGGGIGGLATAALLGKKGHDVSVFEKNASLGGACNRFEAAGFTFDTGPSWYMMPDVFERFFGLLGERVQEHLTLKRLGPSSRIFLGAADKPVELWADLKKDSAAFEALEAGSGARVDEYYKLAQHTYRFLQDNLNSLDESLKKREDLLATSIDEVIGHVAKTPLLQAALLYPMTFLGAGTVDVPALFNFMSYVDLGLGVWHPVGGMYKIVEALVAIGKKNDVSYHTSAPVSTIVIQEGTARGVQLANGEVHMADIVISNADRRFTEEQLLAPEYRDHAAVYWEECDPSYSALLLFLGIGKKLPQLAHHNFILAEAWREQFKNIKHGTLAPEPSFYVSKPSENDPSCAPSGMENIFVLVPMPVSPAFSRGECDGYAEQVLSAIEARAPGFKENIVFQRRWYPEEFGTAYHTFRSSALGLAHTMRQNGPGRPSHTSEKVHSLYFVGATTNPGIGVPTCLLSAEQVALLIGRET